MHHEMINFRFLDLTSDVLDPTSNVLGMASNVLEMISMHLDLTSVVMGTGTRRNLSTVRSQLLLASANAFALLPNKNFITTLGAGKLIGQRLVAASVGHLF